MIEMKPLHYFVAAYEEGSVTAAALRCFIAQPSITHAIKTLENSLATVLFERSNQGITPTEEGEKLYRLATDLLLQNQQLAEAFTPSGEVEIPLYIQPDINIDHYQDIIKQVIKTSSRFVATIAGTIDQAQLAIVDEQLLPATFQFQVVANESYQLVVRRDHPLASLRSVTLDQFESLTFIERPYCTNRKAFERLTYERNISIHYKGKAIHDLQIQGLVKLGLGVAVIPESYIQPDEALAYLPIKLKKPITRSIVLAYRKLPDDLMSTIGNLVLPES